MRVLTSPLPASDVFGGSRGAVRYNPSRLQSMKITKSERDEAAAILRELCPAGSTIYGTIHSVSRSGMSRHMSLYVIETYEDKTQRIRCIDRLACKVGCAGNYSESKEDIQISGCGMNMLMHAVTTLSDNLYKDWKALKYETI